MQLQLLKHLQLQHLQLLRHDVNQLRQYQLLQLIPVHPAVTMRLTFWGRHRRRTVSDGPTIGGRRPGGRRPPVPPFDERTEPQCPQCLMPPCRT